MVIRLSAFADEAASEYSTQLQTLQEERIPYIELRGLDGKNISDIKENEAERYALQTQKAGIRVWAIGSPLGKIGIGDDFKPHMELAKHIFQLAKIFGTDLKKPYDPEGEDRPIEELVQLWETGQFEGLYYSLFWKYPPEMEIPSKYR